MAETFRGLRFDRRSDFAAAREKLRPLWEARQALMNDPLARVAGLFHLEQRAFGLWDGFVPMPTRKESKKPATPLADGWTIFPDEKDLGLKQNWHLAENAPAEGTPVQVGQPWRRALGKIWQDTRDQQVVWYRLDFESPLLPDTGGRIVLRFESIDAETFVWVNGKLVTERSYPHQGDYDSWMTPFEIDISSAIHPGPGNRLVVRVRSEKATAGITDPVSLRVEP